MKTDYFSLVGSILWVSFDFFSCSKMTNDISIRGEFLWLVLLMSVIVVSNGCLERVKDLIQATSKSSSHR